ncbi:MAG: TatD family hydrolase [Deltaproteobacteria bacterium]|nr:TatD family hydrolase [Deltaproteobacteria bacterium]
MSVQLFDSHCHLTDAPLAQDLEGVLQRALNDGVAKLLVPGYDFASSRAACRLAAGRPSLYAAVGLHPAWLEPATEFSPEPFRQLARLRAPVAIGEIGLDYALKDFSEVRQAEVLRVQLELATILSLPVIIHCRRAFAPLYQILRDYPGVSGVLHAYGGGVQMADKFLSLGYYLGFGGGLTRPQARKVRETALMVPSDRILLETDAPYIGSHTVARGESEPRDIRAVALSLAALRQWSPAQTALLTTANAVRLFKLSEKV